MDVALGRVGSARERPFRHIDPMLIAVSFGLAVIGLFMVYSSTRATQAAFHLDPTLYVKKQLAWLVLATVVLLVAIAFDYRYTKVYAGFIYAGLLLLLLLVRTPLGSTVKGAQRSFQVFGFAFSPSEAMKVGLVIMLAAFLSERKGGTLSLTDLWRATFLGAIPMALVFIQPDIGTTIVLVAIMVGVLIVAGARTRHLALLAIVAAGLIAASFQLGIIKSYQISRITGFLDQESSSSAHYNAEQSQIAIGAGGLTGRGYLKGLQTNLDYVPEQHTDFIFTAVGEEFGFAGAVGMLVLFAILLWRAFRIALLSKDAYGTYLAAGIVSMFAIQMFVNIGMTVGIMPITGIPLPFVSYGGSSLLANFAAIGLLMNVHMRRFK
ncbi:MAG: rod shape-determining protein RodA [Actinomycetota bacterium]